MVCVTPLSISLIGESILLVVQHRLFFFWWEFWCIVWFITCMCFTPTLTNVFFSGVWVAAYLLGSPESFQVSKPILLLLWSEWFELSHWFQVHLFKVIGGCFKMRTMISTPVNFMLHSFFSCLKKSSFLSSFTFILWSVKTVNFIRSYVPNPSARVGYDTRSIFKRSLTGLNSEFSFS